MGKTLPFTDFNAKYVNVDEFGYSIWMNPNGTVQLMNRDEALEFMAIKRQILQAQRFK